MLALGESPQVDVLGLPLEWRDLESWLLGQLPEGAPEVVLVGALEGAAGELVQRLQQARPEWAEMLATVSGDLEEAGQMRRRINRLFEAGELAKRDPDPLRNWHMELGPHQEALQLVQQLAGLASASERLWQHGGVSVTWDTRPQRSLEPLLQEGTSLLLATDSLDCLSLDALAATPGHPYVQAALEQACRNVLEGGYSQWVLSGPCMLSGCFARWVAPRLPDEGLPPGVCLLSLGELQSWLSLGIPLPRSEGMPNEGPDVDPRN